jgi:hypothetical protein
MTGPGLIVELKRLGWLKNYDVTEFFNLLNGQGLVEIINYLRTIPLPKTPKAKPTFKTFPDYSKAVDGVKQIHRERLMRLNFDNVQKFKQIVKFELGGRECGSWEMLVRDVLGNVDFKRGDEAIDIMLRFWGIWKDEVNPIQLSEIADETCPFKSQIAPFDPNKNNGNRYLYIALDIAQKKPELVKFIANQIPNASAVAYENDACKLIRYLVEHGRINNNNRQAIFDALLKETPDYQRFVTLLGLHWDPRL